MLKWMGSKPNRMVKSPRLLGDAIGRTCATVACGQLVSPCNPSPPLFILGYTPVVVSMCPSLFGLKNLIRKS